MKPNVDSLRSCNYALVRRPVGENITVILI